MLVGRHFPFECLLWGNSGVIINQNAWIAVLTLHHKLAFVVVFFCCGWFWHKFAPTQEYRMLLRRLSRSLEIKSFCGVSEAQLIRSTQMTRVYAALYLTVEGLNYLMLYCVTGNKAINGQLSIRFCDQYIYIVKNRLLWFSLRPTKSTQQDIATTAKI